jgi:hypothetical protein
MITRYVTAVLLAFAGIGCGLQFQIGAPPRIGSGNVTIQSRLVSEFKQVEAGGAIEVAIAVEDKTAAQLEFDDNLLELVSIESHGDTLIIRTRENYRSKHGLKVRLSTPHLLAIDLSGASKAVIDGVSEDEFAIQLSGASSATVGGRIQHLEVEASGASAAHCLELDAGSITASLSGASSAEVHATESLSVNASGASHLTFTGQPRQIQKQVSGASTVQHRAGR